MLREHETKQNNCPDATEREKIGQFYNASKTSMDLKPDFAVLFEINGRFACALNNRWTPGYLINQTGWILAVFPRGNLICSFPQVSLFQATLKSWRAASEASVLGS